MAKYIKCDRCGARAGPDSERADLTVAFHHRDTPLRWVDLCGPCGDAFFDLFLVDRRVRDERP